MTDSALAAFAYHGGALDVAARLFPDAPKPWIDLSTGINPAPWPATPLPPSALTRLPEAGALRALEAAAARRYRAPAESIVAGGGTQALMLALAAAAPLARVGVLGPTYEGHARALSAAGVTVETVTDLEALGAFDASLVVNPNNPDGRRTRRADLLALQRTMRPGALLIVDEAFADFDGEETLAPQVGAPGLVVMRSLGKAWGLAGLRASFALAEAALAARLRGALGPWPVSGPALALGAAALADDVWFDAAREAAQARAARLDGLLKEAGLTPLGGTALFALAARPDAQAQFLALARRGILVRPFADAPDRLRFGAPAAEADWARLKAGLAAPA